MSPDLAAVVLARLDRIESAVLSGQRLGYTVAEAAAVTSIGRDRLRLEIAAGRLRTVRSGRRIVIPRRELESYMEREAS